MMWGLYAGIAVLVVICLPLAGIAVTSALIAPGVADDG